MEGSVDIQIQFLAVLMKVMAVVSRHPINPDLSGLPEIGGIWNGGIVAGIENASSTGADILLMSLDEWGGFASDVRNIITGGGSRRMASSD